MRMLVFNSKRRGLEMDVVFHAASAGMLAYGLGERRRGQLFLAAAVGSIPDALWLVSYPRPEYGYCYSVLHSIVFNVILCASLCLYNWRIAFGGWLHVFVDVFTHSSTTYHLLYPFAKVRLFNGIDWWHGQGLIVWGALWLVLLSLFIMAYRVEVNSTTSRGDCDEKKE